MNNHTASSLSTKTIIANIATPSDTTTTTNVSNNNHHVTAVVGQNHLQESTKTIPSMTLFFSRRFLYLYTKDKENLNLFYFLCIIYLGSHQGVINPIMIIERNDVTVTNNNNNNNSQSNSMDAINKEQGKSEKGEEEKKKLKGEEDNMNHQFKKDDEDEEQEDDDDDDDDDEEDLDNMDPSSYWEKQHASYVNMVNGFQSKVCLLQ